MDSNHRSRKATDLQSVPFNHLGTYPSRFSMGCTDPLQVSKNKWWAHLDLNQGPTGYEPVALTN